MHSSVNKNESRTFFGHPYPLGSLFFTEMWERFSFYGIRPLLILFMAATVYDGGMGLARENASAIVGIFAGSMYLAALAGAPRAAGPTLEINHRELPTLGVENQTLAASFATLCVDARSQHDYIALSRLFHTVMLFDVPVMTAQLESEARRFIALVDEFYERHVKLVVSAAVPLYDIYQGERLKFEFQRCLSRLQEMQSEEYLKRPHMP